MRADPTASPADRLSFLPALALALAGSIFLLALSLRSPSPSGQVALFFAPGTSQARALAALGALDAAFVRPGRLENIIVAAFEKPAATGALRANGVSFAFDPLIFGGCLVDQGNEKLSLIRTTP